MVAKMKIKQGDKVVILAGKDKGKTGEVITASPKEKRVRVSGVNMIKRHTKPSMSSSGGIVEKEASIDVSNVAIIDPKTSRPVRVGFKILDDGRKVRIAKGSGEVID